MFFPRLSTTKAIALSNVGLALNALARQLCKIFPHVSRASSVKKWWTSNEHMYEYDGSLEYTERKERGQVYLVSLFAFLSLGSLLADGLLYFSGGKVRENNGSETWHGEKWDVKLNWNSSSKSSKSTKSNSLANFALVQFLAKLCHKWRRRAKAIHRENLFWRGSTLMKIMVQFLR